MLQRSSDNFILYQFKDSVLTSLTSGGRSIGIVCLRTKAMGFVSFWYVYLLFCTSLLYVLLIIYIHSTLCLHGGPWRRKIFLCLILNQNSSAGIATDSGQDGQGSIPSRARVSLLHSVHTGSGAQPAFRPLGAETSFSGGKADHTPPSTAEVKNSGAIPPLPHMYSIKHTDNFAFFTLPFNTVICTPTARQRVDKQVSAKTGSW
jgi:hypothetical protein